MSFQKYARNQQPHLPVLLVVVVVDHVPDYHGGHEAHGVTQGVDDPHQCPSKVVSNVLEWVCMKL